MHHPPDSSPTASSGPAPGNAPALPGVSGAAPDRSIAAFDRLGQTLIVTITAGILSRAQAMELNWEIALRMWGPGEEGRVGRGARHVVLDVQNVRSIDSACVGVLVELLRSVQDRGGRVALVHAGDNIEQLFRLTKLDRLFPMSRDVMRAIEALERA